MKQTTKKPTPRQPAVLEAKHHERRDRIERLASELVDVAGGMPGELDRNLTAVCVAALCDAIARSRA